MRTLRLMAKLALFLVAPAVFGAAFPRSARTEPLASTPTPGALCRAAIATTERSTTIPSQLMIAIGLVESGRRDAVTGQISPWPWAVEADGQGNYYDTKAQAIAAVRALQARGIQSIDVGCMQVNLIHHPTAFATLDQAFDPMANALYAARFLTELYGQTHDWPRAAGMYHSGTPELRIPYQAKVMTSWGEERRLAGRAFLSALGPPPAPSGAPPSAGGLFRRGVPASFPHMPVSAARDLTAYRAAPILLAARLPPPISRN